MGGEPSSSSLQSALRATGSGDGVQEGSSTVRGGAKNISTSSGGGVQGGSSTSRDGAKNISQDDPDRGHNKSRNGGRGRDDKPKAKNSGPSRRPRWRVNDKVQPDERLGKHVDKDPRGDDPTRRITKKKAGRNTESFDPSSTLVRPDVMVWVGNPNKSTFDKPLKHDDVVIVPELFGDEDDWDTYYKVSWAIPPSSQ